MTSMQYTHNLLFYVCFNSSLSESCATTYNPMLSTLDVGRSGNLALMTCLTYDT